MSQPRPALDIQALVRVNKQMELIVIENRIYSFYLCNFTSLNLSA